MCVFLAMCLLLCCFCFGVEFAYFALSPMSFVFLAICVCFFAVFASLAMYSDEFSPLIPMIFIKI